LIAGHDELMLGDALGVEGLFAPEFEQKKRFDDNSER